ncbi:unnamed protein product [Linum trigynum]
MVVMLMLSPAANGRAAAGVVSSIENETPTPSPMPTAMIATTSSPLLVHPAVEYWCWQCCCVITIGMGDCCLDHD